VVVVRGALAVLIFLLTLWVGYQFMSREVPQPGHVLVVLAHPDDETMIAGTLVYLQSEGKKIKLAYATDGEGGKVFRPGENGLVSEDFPKETMRALRIRELERALEEIGITDWIRFGAPDEPLRDENGKPSTDLNAFLEANIWNAHAFYLEVLKLMREFRPELVITMGNGADVHVHHKAIGLITVQAAESLAYLPSVYAVSEHRWLGEGGSTPSLHEFKLDLNMTWQTEEGLMPLGEYVYRSIRHHQSQPAGLEGVPRDTERIYLVKGTPYTF
jgi:LmbE family N-acetylglucosaminyl deacetylase